MRIPLEALHGASLNFERRGSGRKTIVAVHGFSGSAATWDSFIQAAESEYSIICPELQGHGKSDSPSDPALYDMSHTIRALEELTVRIGIEKAHWLGYSLGGRVVLAAAAFLNSKILSIVVESASAGIESPEERMARKSSDDALAAKIEGESVQEFADYWQSLSLFSSQINLRTEAKDKLRKERLSNNVRGLSNSLRGIGAGVQEPVYANLPRYEFPCLFVAGGKDGKFVQTAERMQNLVSNSRLFLAQQSGHAVHLEQPEIFNREVLRFMKTAETIPGISPARPSSLRGL